MKVISWTNANPAVALKKDFGFTVGEITVTDQTNGGQWYWNSSMASGYYLRVDTGAVTTSNGFTPLNESYKIGPAISAFTNANPGVITVDSTSEYGFAAGDTIQVVNVADDQSGTSLNGSYTVASVTGTTITTTTNTSARSVWVSGGRVLRVTDTNGDRVSQENQAIRGVTIGTGAVGAASAVMRAVAYSADPAC